MTSITACFCGKEFEVGEEVEVSPAMFYVKQRTCSVDCHNRWVLGHFEGSQPVGDGWMPIVDKLHEDIKALDPNYSISQIKEKFGTLRFYCSYSEPELPLGITREEVYAVESAYSTIAWQLSDIDDPDREDDVAALPDYKISKMRSDHEKLRSLSDRLSPIAALIRKAEDESAETCEWCGKPGDLDNSNYWLLTLCDGCKAKRQEKK